VTLGPRAEGDYYQVLGGLEAGERVVTSGQFMLDSESQLRAAIQQMLEPGATPAVTGTQAAPGHAIEPPAPTGGQEPVVYLCPMPEHVSIQYDHPGNCPICGMKLVPVTPSELRRVRPGGRVLYYTCPMPEHADVHRDKPGQCPRCGMTLIPVMADLPAPPPETSPVPAPAPMTLYTCPMASHADVVADKPGRCPKCGMDLVPTSTVKHGKIAEENWRKQHAAPSTQPPAPAAP
jgi:rubrerythrin